MDDGDAQTAIKAAHARYTNPEWKSMTAKERSVLLKKWFTLITENTDDLANIMTAENGKPLKEAKGEVAYGASFVEFFAEEAKRVYGDVIPSPIAGKHILTIRQPVGVACLITPF